MNRREKQLQEIREQKLINFTSRVYIGTITEVLFDYGLESNEIAEILEKISEKAENLSKGYIDLDTYVEHVSEKTKVNVLEE